MLSLKNLTPLPLFQNPYNSPFCPPKSAKLHLSPLKYQFSTSQSAEKEEKEKEKEKEKKKREEEEEINGVHVARQKYISIAKAELLDAVLTLFESKEEADAFAGLCVCLDSILHAEHRSILEKMRIYYSLSHSQEPAPTISLEEATINEQESTVDHQHLLSDGSDDTRINGKNCIEEGEDKLADFGDSLDLIKLFRSFSVIDSSRYVEESSVAMATDFQHSFMKLLRNAQFEELSAQDLMMTDALNSDYLLTLPIYVDWRKASESNAVIFRRGYGTERQRGLLIVEKLDYLQSKLLQEIFFSLSWPLKIIGSWLNQVLKSSTEAKEIEKWIDKVKIWLKEQYSLENPLSSGDSTFDNLRESDHVSDRDLPIWLAAQRAIPRYEGFLSSIGPRGRLIRKLLNRVGLLPSVSEASMKVDNDFKYSETYMRPDFLPRITLSNIWKPASRESCGNNVWKILKTSLSILFSQSTLQEPAFQELILLYNEETNRRETKDRHGVPLLQLKIYEKIPIPDLSVIFPHKKLSFRILDSVRLDIASILGLLAFFVNYKFENIALSPSAFVLDVIATSALVIYVSRVVLGYKQTWDRYQLLVNRTLYEKTLASGFGSVHFLLDASEQQQYKEAILVYAFLLNSGKYQVSCSNEVGDACERFIYDRFKKKIEMPVDKAIETLLRLDLVSEIPLKDCTKLEVVPCLLARATLKQRWDDLLEQDS